MGRYYYHNLRDKENDVTEAHCLALDEIEQRLDAALDQLSQKTGLPAPAPLASLRDKQVRFTQTVDKDRMVDAVRDMLR